MPKKKADDSSVFQLKVTLRYSKPPIWRRIQVRGSTQLDDLHEILQIVMGWENYHMHKFIVDGVNYGVPVPDWDLDLLNERLVRLDQIGVAEKDKFAYDYDFGDGWEHIILVEEVLPVETGVVYPVCIMGKLACPPEDVGGVWGYYSFLEAIQDPGHPEHEDMMEWIGGSFDPAKFDLDQTNQRLMEVQAGRRNRRGGGLAWVAAT